MRVLHVAAGNLFGGVERILEEIASRAPDHEFALAFPGRLAEALDAARAIRHDLGPARFSRPWTVWRARRRLAAVVNSGPYHAVIAHAPWSFALAAPVVGRSRRVLWAHDAMTGRHWTERRALAGGPDLVLCNSQFTRRALDPWMPAIPREVLYAPVSAPELIPDRRSTRREFGAADDDVVIVHASRLEEWKGHVALIEALTQVTGPWRLWIAGAPQRPHEHDYARALRQRVETHGLAGRVTWLGARTDIGRVLAAADIHCQPNTAPEPFGIAFIEALYAGLPVVTTDFGGAVEIVTSECGTLVPPGDASGLSRALQRLVDDGAARGRLGAAGPQRARALCDPTRQIDELERLIA